MNSRSLDSDNKCLLVDDLDENLLALEALLRPEDARIYKARSGQEALDLLLSHDFAVALIDVQMPGMDGYELAELMRGTELTRNIPIIFVTAGAREPERVFKGYEAGAVDFLFKPLDPYIVRSKIRVFLELHRQKKLLQRQAEEQARLAEKLSASEGRLALALEAAQMGIWDWNLRTDSLTWSDTLQELWSYPPDQFSGNMDAFWARVHLEDHRSIQQAINDAVKGNRDFEAEFRVIPPSGEIRWIYSKGQAVRDSQGQALRLIGTALDVTHLKQTEEKLKQALSVRDEFISIASHELKTPLTSLNLQLQMLPRIIRQQGVAGPLKEKLDKFATTATRQFNRLTALIDDLLDTTRIHHGKLSIDRAEMDLSELTQEVLERFEETTKAAQCKMEISLEPELFGYWDRHRIEQVIVNLISNACKYGRGSLIEVKTEKVDGLARLVVRDHGMGISPDRLPYIFDRFERAVQGSAIQGLGLGLYIVKQIIEAHSGRIHAESEPKKVTTFTVELPLS